MFFLVETTVGVIQTLFSEAEPIFCTSQTGFSVTAKIVGEVLAAFVHPSRIFQRILPDSRRRRLFDAL